MKATSTNSVAAQATVPGLDRGRAPLLNTPPGGFLLCHAWLPLAAFGMASAVLMLARGDLAIADYWYALQGHRWALKSAFVTQTLIHLTGRNLSTLAELGICVAWLTTYWRSGARQWRRPLGYLALSMLLSTALVAWVKSWSNMDCPWDLLRYGGDRPYIGLLALRPIGMPRAVCFPAGHASAGYAWLGLYFFFLATRPRLRWLGLAIGLSAGLTFGIGQQLRGAHFASHDLWTATICWMTALGLYRLPWTTPATAPAQASAIRKDSEIHTAWLACTREPDKRTGIDL